MEKEINRHLEAIEDLEDSVDIDIEKLFLNLDIEELADDPLQALEEFAEALDLLLDDKYHDEALKEGIRFAKATQRKKIEI